MFHVSNKRQALGLLIGLAIQYLLGIAANLYVKFPDTGSKETMFRFAWQHFNTAAHIIVGLGLLLGSISFIVQVMRAKASALVAPAWVGFLAIVAAAYSGAQFVATQNDAYSFVMAVGFIVAAGAYVWALVVK